MPFKSTHSSPNLILGPCNHRGKQCFVREQIRNLLVGHLDSDVFPAQHLNYLLEHRDIFPRGDHENPAA
jgi:hypothetical protein